LKVTESLEINYQNQLSLAFAWSYQRL